MPAALVLTIPDSRLEEDRTEDGSRYVCNKIDRVKVLAPPESSCYLSIAFNCASLSIPSDFVTAGAFPAVTTPE